MIFRRRRVFEKLYHCHAKGVFSLAWHLCCYRQEDAEDVTQETFLRALKGYEKYKDQSTEFAWLRKICLNIVRERWRRSNFFKEHVQQANQAFCAAVRPHDPLKVAQSTQALEQVIKAMEYLNPKFREVIILKHLTGLSDMEIAEIQSIDVATVRSRVRRARKELSIVIAKETL